MEPGGAARATIQALVNELAKAEGIDPERLRFTWDKQREIIAHGGKGLALRETFQVLTISLEKSWRILTFPESTVRSSIQQPVLLRLAYRDTIVSALRGLKRQKGSSSVPTPFVKSLEKEPAPRGASRGV